MTLFFHFGVGGAAERVGDEVGDVRVGKAVENVLAVAAPANQVRRTQDSQTLGNGGEAIVVDAGDLRDAEFTFGEKGQQTQAGRVTEGSENADGTFNDGGSGRGTLTGEGGHR